MHLAILNERNDNKETLWKGIPSISRDLGIPYSLVFAAFLSSVNLNKLTYRNDYKRALQKGMYMSVFYFVSLRIQRFIALSTSFIFILDLSPKLKKTSFRA